MTPEEFMQLNEQKSASHRFEDVEGLIADDAIFWFNSGSFSGKDSIRKAFTQTWALNIQDEKYWMNNFRWWVKAEDFAICTFAFHWTGVVDGKFEKLGDGRGTCVVKRSGSEWTIAHGHLSREPVQLV